MGALRTCVPCLMVNPALHITFLLITVRVSGWFGFRVRVVLWYDVDG